MTLCKPGRTVLYEDGFDDLTEQMQLLAAEIAGLKDLTVVFERWHQDMIILTTRSSEMHEKGQELQKISRHLIMTSLNAAIEAAHGGKSARGFAVVATEVRALALRAQALSKDLGGELHKTELVTTATFQDIQAGGKLMMAVISGLDSIVKRLRSRLA